MTGSSLDVVVVGNVGVDTNSYGLPASADDAVESAFTENLDCVGQAGGYASRGYAQLGKRTAFIGYVGDDYCGRFIREEFSRDGIDMQALFLDPEGTSRSVNLMQSDGRRRNYYDGKGHMHLQPDPRICQAVLAQSGLAHFHIPNWARHLLPMAKRLGLTIACDIQDVVAMEDPYRQDFVDHADILFFSAVNHPDPRALIGTFLRARPDQVVIAGMGARGCALGTTEDGIRFFPAVEMEFPVVDTNGAGDGLAVGFLTSYVLDGFGLDDSILRGQIAARHTCSLKASSSDLITIQQLDFSFRTLSHRTAGARIEHHLRPDLGS